MATSAQRDELSFPKGTVIFRQGDPGNEMFVIEKGRVRLTLGTAGHEKEVAVLGRGEFFGELSLLSGAARTATAQAVEDSTLLAIGRDVFAMMVQDDLDVVFRMMNAQGQRLSRTNQPIQQLMQRLGRVRILTNCLRRLLGTQPPACTIDVAALAADVGLGADEVTATINDAVLQGAGTLHDHGWRLQGQDQLQQLIEVLARYAEPIAV
jgi:CRP/FNR family cyclic AMP-dependent transcriptional regulator